VLLADLLTQYASWRLVYAADVVTAIVITATASAAPDVPRRRRTPPDVAARRPRPASGRSRSGRLTSFQLDFARRSK
jgi:hypothetical protein